MTDEPESTIVVGVDGSEPSIEALRWAARQAEVTSAALHVVTAWSFPNEPTPFDIVPDLPPRPDQLAGSGVEAERDDPACHSRSDEHRGDGKGGNRTGLGGPRRGVAGRRPARGGQPWTQARLPRPCSDRSASTAYDMPHAPWLSFATDITPES